MPKTEESKNPCERFPAGSSQRSLCEMRQKMESDPLYHAIGKEKAEARKHPVGPSFVGAPEVVRANDPFYSAEAEWARARGFKVHPTTGELISPYGTRGKGPPVEREEPEEPRRMPFRRAGGGGRTRRPSTRRMYRDAPWLSDAPPDELDKEIADKNLRGQFDRMRKDYPEHVDYIDEWQKKGISPSEAMSNLSKEKMGQAELPEHPDIAERAEKKKWEGRREEQWEQKQEDRAQREEDRKIKKEEKVIKEFEDIVEPQVKEHLKPPKDYSETKGYRDLDRYYRGTPLGEAVNKASRQGNTSYQFANELRNRIFMPDGTIDDRYIPPDIGNNLEAQEEFVKMLELSLNEEQRLLEYFRMSQ